MISLVGSLETKTYPVLIQRKISVHLRKGMASSGIEV
jgi:hypothetical protein